MDWGDMPMCYDDVWLGVDTSGNMGGDGVWNYTWENGRVLARAVDNDNVFFWDYTYDANGMRIRRDGLASSYSYTYVGGQLTQMTTGSHTFRFAYDAAGIPVTVIYNGTTYYYLTNLQGDIVGITDETGVQVVTYTYDAWGKPLTTTGTLADTLGLYNPLRYRGYVYDTETGLYYLQSRYYSPTLRRFINADVYLSTGQGLIGHNMFAYCNNNPVSLVDSNGKLPFAANQFRANALLFGSDAFGGSSIEEGALLRDVTEEINSALYPEAYEATMQRLVVNHLPSLMRLGGEGYIYTDFYNKVNHKAEWDIKREEPWESTIGTTFPGKDVQVIYDGAVMTPESLGNYTYGFIGRAKGINLPVLLVGSYYAAGFPTGGADLANELKDWLYIAKGYFAYP